MQIEFISPSERASLQSRITQLCKSMSSKTVSLLATAHSDDCASIIITVTGLTGIMQNTVVLTRKTNSNPTDPNELLSYTWYGYSQGYKYKFSGISELQTLIRKQLNIIYNKVGKN